MPKSCINLKKKRIRSFFSTFETSSRSKDKIEDLQTDIINGGLAYIQMKLPIKKITPEFEKDLSEKVEHNILHAKVREASEDDLQNVMYLYSRAWMTSHTQFSPITIDSLKNIYNYHDTVILIAKVYDSDVGFIILDFEGPNNQYGIIAGLGVIPRFQRKGLGTTLGMAALNYFKQKGVKELRCEVYIENEISSNFIKSMGFEEYETKVY